MAKKKTESDVKMETLRTEIIFDALKQDALITFSKLYNQTKKYYFELEEKYGQIYFTVIKKNTSNHHIGTFKFENIDELKSSPDILRYIQLENKDTFFNNFKYK